MPAIYADAEIDPIELVGFARTALDADQSTQALGAWFPNQLVDDVQFSIDQVPSAQMTIAEYRAPNTEGKIADRFYDVVTKTGQIPPMTEVDIMREYDRLRVRNNPGNAILEQTFENVAARVRACSARINLARGETLENASMTINEGGVQATIDWGRDPSHEYTLGTLWTNTAATGLTDLFDAVETYIDTNGYAPGGIICSTKVRNDFRQLDQVLNAVGATGDRATVSELDELMADQDLPPFIINDEKYVTSAGDQRVISDQKFILGPPPSVSIGRTVYGVAAEADDLGLVGAEAPGIVAQAWRTTNPTSIATLATAWTVPVLAVPDATLTVTCR